jgi:hypothetical protein
MMADRGRAAMSAQASILTAMLNQAEADLRHALATKDARIAELTEALRPFAAFAKVCDGKSDDYLIDMAWRDDDEDAEAAEIRLRDCRNALAALHSPTLEGGT